MFEQTPELRTFPRALCEAAQTRFVAVRRRDQMIEYLWGAMLCRDLVVEYLRIPAGSLVILANTSRERCEIEAVEGSVQDLELRYRIVPVNTLPPEIRSRFDDEDGHESILRSLIGRTGGGLVYEGVEEVADA